MSLPPTAPPPSDRSPADQSSEQSWDQSPGPDAGFRLEVGRLRARDRRRSFPAELRLGHPGGRQVALELPRADAGLRLDLVTALLDRWRDEHGGGPAYGWLVRPGVPTLHDLDPGWYAATGRAFGALGLPLLGFRAVTRAGWLDVVTGERRVWKRLRLSR
jgi:hypothetical protein